MIPQEERVERKSLQVYESGIGTHLQKVEQEGFRKAVNVFFSKFGVTMKKFGEVI